MNHGNNNTRKSTPVLREPLSRGSLHTDHQSSLARGDLPYAPGIFLHSSRFGRQPGKSLPPIRTARTGEVKSGHNAPRFAQVSPSRASGHNPQATPRFWALSRLSNHRGWCRSDTPLADRAETYENVCLDLWQISAMVLCWMDVAWRWAW